jgi:GDP-L-fucose synthase
LIELIAQLTEYHGCIVWDTTKPNGQPRRCLNTDRARRLFGFNARTDFREGLRRTIAWFLSVREADSVRIGAIGSSGSFI